ncbi:hypothetical protein ACFRIC_08740 [Streptomyces sp. NPDC056738]|uniref:hypothetical protein n=1 Tax=Streptomyces sp. NPDC056738 TaxID=3345933 RepID=UPI0036C8CA96
MTAESPAQARRRALLGDEVIDHINACVDASPEPEPGAWVDALRRIFNSSPVPEPQAAVVATPHTPGPSE